MRLSPVPVLLKTGGVSVPLGRGAFTLIEILVVVGIIGLLISILLPSLARSRELTRSVMCKTNLSQLGKGLVLYANDYRGMLPYENRGEETSAGRVCWFDAVDRYLGKARVEKTVKICPTVALDSPTLQESYRMNSKLAEAATAGNPQHSQFLKPYRKIDTLERPGATVVLFDGKVNGVIVSFKGRWRMHQDDVSYRHNLNTNLLFADWHVEGMNKKVLYAKSIKNSPVIWQPADVGPWDPDPKQ
jgi:prepilin-type N-terminal cleavage/methylation domain-containing protein/prepilin-type processing-associated H-X9-DG protein